MESLSPRKRVRRGADHLDYARCARSWGLSHAPEVFNCSAPDRTQKGFQYGSEDQKSDGSAAVSGEIPPACEAEPDVASSDATNIQRIGPTATIYNQLSQVVDFGRGRPRCRMCDLHGKTARRLKIPQHSMNSSRWTRPGNQADLTVYVTPLRLTVTPTRV